MNGTQEQRRSPEKGYDPQLSLKELSTTISALGIKKANTRGWQLLLLGVLAGLYISFGGHVSLVALQQGAGRIVAGLVFSFGLVLVVVAGAELFTGNVIMIVGAMTRQFPVRLLLKNWLIVYIGNLIGAYGYSLLVWKAGLLLSGGAAGSVGSIAASVADAKMAMPFMAAFLRGVLCNMLVVLAIIMATMAKDLVSKVVLIMLPIMVFVACGFEHCVANMFLIPTGLLAKGAPWGAHVAIYRNIVAVTLGNIVGGILILIVHPNRLRQLYYLWNLRTPRQQQHPS